MPTTPRDTQPCRLISLTGLYLTTNNTWSEDPKQAATTERWFLEMKASQLKIPTVIIRA